jgi:hypothetical protein
VTTSLAALTTFAALAVAAPATAQAPAPEKPLMTKTDARDAVSLCW